MNSPAQVLILLVLAAVAGIYIRRALESSLADPSRFPATAWGWPEAVFSGGLAGFFLWMAAASVGREPVKVDLETVLTSLALYGAICILLLGFLLTRGINPIDAFGLRWRSWKSEWICIPVSLILAFPFIYLAQGIAYQISGPQTNPQPIVTFLLENPGWRDRLAVALVAIIAAPVTEELIFRGCLYGVCRRFAGRWAGMFFSSVVFALIHGHLPSLPGLLILAIALTLVYERTGSLWAAIGLHALFNGLTVLAAILWPELAP